MFLARCGAKSARGRRLASFRAICRCDRCMWRRPRDVDRTQTQPSTNPSIIEMRDTAAARLSWAPTMLPRLPPGARESRHVQPARPSRLAAPGAAFLVGLGPLNFPSAALAGASYCVLCRRLAARLNVDSLPRCPCVRRARGREGDGATVDTCCGCFTASTQPSTPAAPPSACLPAPPSSRAVEPTRASGAGRCL